VTWFPNRRDPTSCPVSLTIKVGAFALFVSVRIRDASLDTGGVEGRRPCCV